MNRSNTIKAAGSNADVSPFFSYKLSTFFKVKTIKNDYLFFVTWKTNKYQKIFFYKNVISFLYSCDIEIITSNTSLKQYLQ